MNTPHLLATISYHGYGHIAQTAAVVTALRGRRPDLRLTLWTEAPHAVLQRWFGPNFVHLAEPVDVGMIMTSAIDVERDASMAAYHAFHADWEGRVRKFAGRLRELAPDLVLSNVSYLALAGAAQADIPGFALCSLNWGDVYRAYCPDDPQLAGITKQIEDGYNSAIAFLQPEPSMPMPALRNAAPIGPLARVGRDCRTELRARLNLSASDRVVLVSLGGIPTRLSVEHWPQLPGVHWLLPPEISVGRPDMTSITRLERDFIDVLASCDALLTKPGYGSFAEAACNGIPLLYVPRGDWPEEPHLVGWMRRKGCCVEISRAELESGVFAAALERLWQMPARPRVAADGAEHAAARLSIYLE